MKFLYFGDLHERQTAPENRKDDFRATLNAKIEEIRSLGQKHKVKAFLQPGDFLDKPKFDTTFLSQVMNRWGFWDIQQDLLAFARGEITAPEIADKFKNNIPMVGAIGNHELYGNALKSYENTSLAFLEKIGFMHLPDRDHPLIFTDESGFTVAITATHYDIHMDHPGHEDDYIVEKKLGDFHIHLVHGYLTNRDMGSLLLHTTVDDIAKKTKADLTITGHDHIGFDLMEVDGKLFVNSGAVVRLSNDPKEVRRKPKVLLIDITKENGISVKKVYLKSAQPGEDVLDRSHKVFQKTMSSKLEEIKSLVNKSNVGSGLNITDIIKAISESQQLDDALKDRAIAAVTEKMKNIESQTVPAQDYIIEKIVLTNFQSHSYNEFALKNGLNVFIGKSSSGKSAIQRALALVYENAGTNPRRYIKNGEENASVSLYLSNGMIISRVIERKKSGKNGYEVYNPADGSTTYYNTKSLPLIQELLGFSELQIDENKSVPLNFQKQGVSWFFIGDSFTNSDRAKIIGAVYKTHYVDAVIKDLESQTKKFSTQIKDKQKEIIDTEQEMAKFDHLPALKKTIQEVEKRLANLQTLQAKVDKAKALQEERIRIEQQIEIDQKTVQSLKDLPEIETRLQALLEKEVTRKRIITLTDQLSQIEANLNKENNILNQLANLPEAEQRLNKLEAIVDSKNKLREKWEKAVSLESEQANIQKSLEQCKDIIEKLKGLPLAEEKLQTIEFRIQQVEQAKRILKELNEITERGLTERKEIDQVIRENHHYVKTYQALLEKVGTCPVCQSEVDQHTIQQISDSYLIQVKKGREKHVS